MNPKPAEPVVSVVMPVYNGQAYLRQAARSILDQSLNDLELIAVDDGSTDASLDILTQLASEDGRVRVIQQAHEGIVVALNRGCAEAKSPLIARMDCDDIADSSRLADQTAFLKVHDRVALVGTAARVIGPAGQVSHILAPPTEPAEVRRQLQHSCCMIHPSVMLRREVLRTFGGYRAPLRHAEDYDLWLRISERHDVANLAKPLLSCRVHGGQVSTTTLVTQAVRALSAQVAAQWRRQGRPDPVENDAILDEAWLLAHEVSARAVDMAILDGFVQRLEMLASVCDHASVQQIQDQLNQWASQRKIHRAVRGRVRWSEAYRLMRQGRTLAGLIRASQAAALNPTLPFQMARRWVDR
ncbi:MAG: glycosyltransferase [Phycisphaeraceae bacterium]|nr:glycosyltransferase [Phycisphaeraceae bacterium]